MRFLIISHALHKTTAAAVFSYAPYVREMNLWLKHVDAVTVIAPKTAVPIGAIDLEYKHDKLKHTVIPEIAFTSVKRAFYSLLQLPFIFKTLIKACKAADHIHLRCPGNIGLLGCLVQVFFPKKIKTAKYAGNWDPNAQQPLSYRFQKWILSHPFLTRNMQVLVYGKWGVPSKNIKPFFTASYHDYEIETPVIRDYTKELHFVFVGALVIGKRPLYAIQLIAHLHQAGKTVRLDLYGDGVLKAELLDYITIHKLEGIVKLQGNQPKAVVKTAIKRAHFSILASQSEGWPKAVAEAMFFGAIPIATSISCVPFMLDYGKRGLLITGDLKQDIPVIMDALAAVKTLDKLSKNAVKWSQCYTLETFESEIMKLIN